MENMRGIQLLRTSIKALIEMTIAADLLTFIYFACFSFNSRSHLSFFFFSFFFFLFSRF